MRHTVVLLGTLDTKGAEYAFLRDRLASAGVDAIVVDVGVLGTPEFEATIGRSEVASAAGADLDELRLRADRGQAVSAMAAGARRIVADLHAEGRINGAIALGGTGGTSIAAEAFRRLPLGFPKIIVSTAASGATEQYIGESDLILIPSVVDIAGLNRVSMRVLANAAAALVGMVGVLPVDESSSRPLIGASMFGVTTPCVTRARERLEGLGYEVLVFHMTGTGGRALESLAAQGLLAGVLDLTTTELADNEVGGVFSAGPDRVTAAGKAGIPQVIAPGALDMVNFGPLDEVPARFRERRLHVHNSSVTLMRTTAAECARLGAELARKALEATGPTTVMLPLRGVSAIAVEGETFFDLEADRALFDAIRVGLAGSAVDLIELDASINDPLFADTAVDVLHAAIASH